MFYNNMFFGFPGLRGEGQSPLIRLFTRQTRARGGGRRLIQFDKGKGDGDPMSMERRQADK